MTPEDHATRPVVAPVDQAPPAAAEVEPSPITGEVAPEADDVAKAVITAGPNTPPGILAPAQQSRYVSELDLEPPSEKPEPATPPPIPEPQIVDEVAKADDAAGMPLAALELVRSWSDDELLRMHDATHEIWHTGVVPDIGRGRRRVRGPADLVIEIEYDAGDVRVGYGRDGREWKRIMRFAYGSLPGTVGLDGEELDVYLAPRLADVLASDWAFVAHQRKITGDGEFGGWDEDKIMLGFNSAHEAREAYLAHYPDPRILGGMTKILIDELAEAIRTGDAGTGAAWDGPAEVQKAKREMPTNVVTTIEALKACLHPERAA